MSFLKLDCQEIVQSWHVLYTRTNQERNVRDILIDKGIECYLPLIKTMKQWADRKKMVEEVLFKSYIFVRSSTNDHFNILNVKGACYFIEFEGRKAIVPDKQILAIRNTLENNFDFEINTCSFLRGEKVFINQIGPLNGLEGEIIDQNNRKRILIRIDCLNQGIIVNVPIRCVGKKRIVLSEKNII